MSSVVPREVYSRTVRGIEHFYSKVRGRGENILYCRFALLECAGGNYDVYCLRKDNIAYHETDNVCITTPGAGRLLSCPLAVERRVLRGGR